MNTLKLPTTMPNGKRTKLHPLLWCLENRMPEGATKSDIARGMGVKPQSLSKWQAKCRADRNFSLPAERAAQLAQAFGVPAALFRPDIAWGA